MKKTATIKPHETVVTHDMLLNHVQEVTGIPSKYHRGYTCQELLKILEQYQSSIVTENNRIRRQIGVLIVKMEDNMQISLPF
jgi:hypothetical protein